MSSATHLACHGDWAKSPANQCVFPGELIRRFNSEGMDLLKERKRSGRPSDLTEEEEADIVEYACYPPKALGRPFSHWSLEKLRESASFTALLRGVGTPRYIAIPPHLTWRGLPGSCCTDSTCDH